MLWAGFLSLAALCTGAAGKAVRSPDRVAARACLHHPSNGGSIYDYTEMDLFENSNVSLSDYKGKYLDMNVLQESFSDFVILGFPCNQFGMQEPGSNASEIYNGIKYVRPGNGFEPNFALMKKVDVNGENEHPLYTYLKEYCPSTREYFADTSRLYYKPQRNNDVRWNWEKFLITKNGKPFMRYDPGTKPNEIRNDISFLLTQEI